MEGSAVYTIKWPGLEPNEDGWSPPSDTLKSQVRPCGQPARGPLVSNLSSNERLGGMKIAISGSHGTGKSTLLQLLEAKGSLGELSVLQEVPRALCSRVKDPAFFHRRHNNLTRQLLLIAAQVAEEAMMVTAPTVVVDRTVVDHWAYTLSLLSESDVAAPEASEVQRLVREWAGTYDHIFYLPIEFDLAVDDVREEDLEFQREIDELLRAEYRRLSIPVTELRGSVDQRAAQLVETVRGS